MDSKIDFLFYGPDLEKNLTLDAPDANHCIKVLRKKAGDSIAVTDGKGGLFDCIIDMAHPKNCTVKIVGKKLIHNSGKRKITLAISPTKNADRIEYLVEKAVEIGINEIYFLKTVHTYPKKINLERIKKIVISATKQSLKFELPIVHDLIEYSKFIENSQNYEQKFMAHYDEKATELTNIKLSNHVLILIGPEGDFTQEEIALANKSGFETVTLGSSRLRTETAGLVALSLLNLL